MKLSCPFKSPTQNKCYHIYAKRIKTMGNNYKTKCMYPKNFKACPLYKKWLEQLDNNLKNYDLNIMKKNKIMPDFIKSNLKNRKIFK